MNLFMVVVWIRSTRRRSGFLSVFVWKMKLKDGVGDTQVFIEDMQREICGKKAQVGLAFNEVE